MNKNLKSFLQRGMLFSGFGPVISGIIYLILDNTISDFSLTGTEAFVAIISTYILAFVHAGASVFNQIDEWPMAKSTFFHFLTLYVSYTLCYIINSWIPFEPIILLIFTAIFVVGYFVIWVIVYFSIKATSKKMNRSLAK